MAIFKKILKWQGLGCRGMSIVETALVLPALLIFFLVMIETSNLFKTWLTLQKAAQTGARYASTGQGEIEGTRINEILQVTDKMMENLPYGDRNIKVRSWQGSLPVGPGIVGVPGEPCQMVQVEIEYNYELIIPLPSPMLPLLPEAIPLKVYDRKINEPWKPCS